MEEGKDRNWKEGGGKKEERKFCRKMVKDIKRNENWKEESKDKRGRKAVRKRRKERKRKVQLLGRGAKIG